MTAPCFTIVGFLCGCRLFSSLSHCTGYFCLYTMNRISGFCVCIFGSRMIELLYETSLYIYGLSLLQRGCSRAGFCVQFSCSVVSDCLWLHGLQHARPPGVHSNSCPLSQWCHPTISSSVVAFSSCPQSFSASGAFPMSQFFPSGNQSIGVSALVSVLPALHYSHILPCFRKPTLPRKHYGSSFSDFPLESCHEYIHSIFHMYKMQSWR